MGTDGMPSKPLPGWTAGKWYVAGNGIETDECFVCTVANGDDPALATADRALIAAAPDLYESLVEAADELEWLIAFARRQFEFEGDVDATEALIGKARAVLARARGES